MAPQSLLSAHNLKYRTLRQADHLTFKIRPPTFEKLANTRTFTSTSRIETRNPDSTSARKPGTWRPYVFTLGISLLAFGLAIDKQIEIPQRKIDYIRTHQGTFPSWFSKTFTGYASYLDPSDAQLQQLRKLDKLNFIKDYGLNSIFPHHLLNWYINLGEGKQICCVIALINCKYLPSGKCHASSNP
ncbi:hypothetical protein H4Q26_017175 [Puccinia striiformis f. sp. tritici PST-130]|nr:hypothetical protein H4Q26_017175 [Puccinia striiformis f. sp. tritici PST-130]